MKIINQGIINKISPYLHADYVSAYGDPNTLHLSDIIVFSLIIISFLGILFLPLFFGYHFLKKRN